MSDPRLSPDGAAWLAKALHPADVTLDVHGVPTLEGVPTATLDYMTTQTIAAPSAAAWGAEVFLNPNPMYFGKVITNTATPTYGCTTIYNPNLSTAAWSEFGQVAHDWHVNAMAGFKSNAIRYRLLYASVTATMSASQNTNQGTVVMAQYPKVPESGYSAVQASLVPNPSTFYMARKASWWDVSRPTTTQLQQLKGAVSWDAKEGAYVILKLDETSLNWKNTGESELCFGSTGSVMGNEQAMKQGKDAVDFFGYAAAAAVEAPFGPDGSWCRQLPSGTAGTTVLPLNTGVGSVAAHYPPACQNWGHIVFAGLDPAATLMLTFRVGFEVVVPPGSAYSQSVTMPVHYDLVALEHYFRASRGMMAGYPARYNIFGAILPFLKKAGEFVIPKIGNFIGGLFGGGNNSASAPQATTPGRAMTLIAPPAPQLKYPPGTGLDSAGRPISPPPEGGEWSDYFARRKKTRKAASKRIARPKRKLKLKIRRPQRSRR